MKIRTKFLSISIVPMIIVVLAVMLVVQWQLQQLENKEVDTIRSEMMETRQQELKNYIDMAMGAIRPLQHRLDMRYQEKIAQAQEVLNGMTFGEGGFIYGYDLDGNIVFHSGNTDMIGKSVLDLKDPDGKPFVRDIIETALDGGGFVQFRWPREAGGEPALRLTYAREIEVWGWVIATGFFIDDIESQVALREANIGHTVTQTMIWILASGLVLAVLVSAVNLLLSRRILGPLQLTAQALLDIAEGEGDLTRRLDVHSRDEVGDVARGFNGFVEKIHQLVKEVQVAVGSLSQSTASMTQVVDQTQADTRQQREDTGRTAASIQEMVAAVQEVASSATMAAEAAQQADANARNGDRVVEETIRSINQLADDVHRSAEVITRLGVDADAIGSVVSVISGIAEQTNLLALNAAIEAARAGDQGRGFSVVADEVRTLASRTQQSTEEIQRMIERLQSGAREAVTVMSRSREQSAATTERAEDATRSLQQITASVATISEMNTQIAGAAEQQTAVANEIDGSVQQVAAIADKADHNASILADTTAGMAQLEQRLSQLVMTFKV
ncbi:methyl-accepting chemotaxis protein [Marinobacterium sediminicola]|uniref:Methyl-accepting chemotaxis sensory transducer with Cache sensor n=1 Tax=Marinobacterium sediminicola TaxID=518898 RepID=A0ABY1S486_9GAMM|nr:methyl-accepting chemotaxis protein [Marinobacterium sediminicola]ULG70182.1 methyl-accepting chemotaxis protein [Marinobacterium sediminicola]SMR78348.1 methyl-accepting chemotaxis sensory transducer with Cache sensor [Marinobacterium sediminicola]